MYIPTIFFPTSFLRIKPKLRLAVLQVVATNRSVVRIFKIKIPPQTCAWDIFSDSCTRMGWSLDTRTCSHKMSLSQIRLLSWKVGPASLPPTEHKDSVLSTSSSKRGGLSSAILSLSRGVRVRHLTHCSECLGSLGVPLVCAPIVTEPCTFRDTLKPFYTKLATYIPTSVSPSWPSSWPKNQWSPETNSSNVIDITIPGEHSAQRMEVKSQAVLRCKAFACCPGVLEESSSHCLHQRPQGFLVPTTSLPALFSLPVPGAQSLQIVYNQALALFRETHLTYIHCFYPATTTLWGRCASLLIDKGTLSLAPCFSGRED